MVRDRRYSVLMSVWKAGDLHSFSQIFDIIPKTIVTRDLGMNYRVLTKLTRELSTFNVRRIAEIAGLLGIPSKDLFTLIIDEMRERDLTRYPLNKSKASQHGA